MVHIRMHLSIFLIGLITHVKDLVSSVGVPAEVLGLLTYQRREVLLICIS